MGHPISNWELGRGSKGDFDIWCHSSPQPPPILTFSVVKAHCVDLTSFALEPTLSRQFANNITPKIVGSRTECYELQKIVGLRISLHTTLHRNSLDIEPMLTHYRAANNYFRPKLLLLVAPPKPESSNTFLIYLLAGVPGPETLVWFCGVLQLFGTIYLPEMFRHACPLAQGFGVKCCLSVKCFALCCLRRLCVDVVKCCLCHWSCLVLSCRCVQPVCSHTKGRGLTFTSARVLV